MPDPAAPHDEQRVTVYSVGHSNHSLQAFVELLQRHGIESLVDVRSAPYSRYVTHFNRHEMEEAIERHGIRYTFLGEELGGRPLGDDYYDEQDHVRYDRMAVAPFFLRGLEKLIDEAAQYRTAMMCSEEDPTGCHRHLLIARVVEERSEPPAVRVLHIRADDREQTEDDLRPAAEPPGLWDALLEPTREEAEWKSIRPVSRRRPPSSSSSPSDEWASDDS
jgi:uncharacterized protein (DUF488 family)